MVNVEYVKQLMQERELSQKALAVDMRLTESCISRILSGKRAGSLEFVEGLARAFPDVDLRNFLTVPNKGHGFETIIPGGFGTADLIIATPKKLYITDLKYGKGVVVKVSEGLNPQLCIYAYGAYTNFRFLYPDVESVVMSIFQPRVGNVDSFEIQIGELMEWAEGYVRPKAIEAAGPDGVLVPGDHCKFCKAKGVCRARADEALKLAQERFTVIDGTYETSQGEMPIDFGAEVIYGSDQADETYPVRFPTVQFALTATDKLSEIADRIRKELGYKPMHPMDGFTDETCDNDGWYDFYIGLNGYTSTPLDGCIVCIVCNSDSSDDGNEYTIHLDDNEREYILARLDEQCRKYLEKSCADLLAEAEREMNECDECRLFQPEEGNAND